MSKQHLKILSQLLGGLLTIMLAFLFYENRLFDLMKLYIGMGCVFIVVAVLTNVLDKLSTKISLLFFLLQAIAFFYASKVPIEDDDSLMKLMILLAGVLYVGLAIYFLTSADPSLRKRRRRKSSGSRHPRQVNP
ncbi:hypothetical protein EXU57_11585 [Segetibacter sp. 3557_3]|uniref:hypothetical protein n=1 Tax=Segetibacter sp. 3557_3 TaxID=2547429 RepID=UPI00105866CF|nr:hypothetical protein [Segetibacter sp. 3557_3]TDH26128.1 hypothetical protein EXU57_11585 [Segetibacter sp. 3557_3]